MAREPALQRRRGTGPALAPPAGLHCGDWRPSGEQRRSLKTPVFLRRVSRFKLDWIPRAKNA